MKRVTFLYFLLFLSFGVLVFRLFSLTIIEGAHNRELADGQRIRLHKIVAPRGMIFDRNGKPLVQNVPIYKLKGKTIERDEALKLEAAGKEGDLVVEVGREYPYKEATAHLLGYLGEATEEEVKERKFTAGQLVGRTGLEQQYEDLLRGKDGGELLEMDTYGVTVRKLGKREPVSGKDIFLSIDIGLQKAAYEAMGEKPGVVVALDPRNGQILALVSSPSFDPNIFLNEIKNVEEIINDPDKPMFNRAITGAYPPGSTFKIVTSTAGLETGKINESTRIEDTGQIVIGIYRYANWYFTKQGKTEGKIGVVRAITRSTDTFFYKVGEFVGADELVNWADKFGLGKLTGIDLPDEYEGFLPDPSKEWFLGNTYHLSIGQGHLGLTPLQVARMTGVVASGGKLCELKVSGPSSALSGAERASEGKCENVGLKEETLKLIEEGMRGACSPGGTAGIFFDYKPEVACKTGTAEFDDPKGRTHAWLTAFAPADKPEIVVTALVEAGGEGSTVAAPIAKKVLEEYFKKEN
ncbi:MAG: penicillin-binding transpeptidase domain-containing protein [bacterium]|nr:penicillin-binding transpeptidase domain-containing protein [bacterium]